MRNSLTSVWVFVIIVLFFYCGSVSADSTTVLPKGRTAITTGYLWSDIVREYDDESSDRELGYYLNGTDLTEIGEAVVLQGLIAGGFPPGALAASDILDYARSSLDADAHVQVIPIMLSYGLTDKLTVGIEMPYYIGAETNFDFDVEALPSSTAALVPIAPGVSLADYINSLDAREVAQNFLEEELGFDELEDWEGEAGIGDIKLSIKYLFLAKDKYQAAAGGWLKIPTGRIDDERNLTDISYGSGSYDTALFAMVDYMPVKPVTLNLTGRYVVAWPFDRSIYILDEDNEQFYEAEFATKRESGMYDIGDWYELEGEVKFEVFKYADLFGGYYLMESQKYRIDGDEIPKSIHKAGKYFYGLDITTVRAYQEGGIKIPFIVRAYGESFDQGRNVNKAERYIVALTILF